MMIKGSTDEGGMNETVLDAKENKKYLIEFRH